jgi:uncharacterized protein with GYD domain
MADRQESGHPMWVGPDDPSTPVFILMMDVTEQGNSSLDRLDRHYDWLRERARDLGGQLLGYFLTLGPHDLVAVVTLTDDESAFDLVTQVAADGRFSASTMRAFSLDYLLERGHH